MNSIEWLENRIKVLIPEDIGSQLMFKSNVEKAKEKHKVEHGKTWDAALDAGQSRAWNVMRAYSDFDDWYDEQSK